MVEGLFELRGVRRDGRTRHAFGRRVEIYGNIAQVFSAYEGKKKLTDEKPFLRGINSFQLMNDGKRWWVITIFWQQETPDNPIPKEYLKSDKKNKNKERDGVR
jgi:hypothetical protein